MRRMKLVMAAKNTVDAMIHRASARFEPRKERKCTYWRRYREEAADDTADKTNDGSERNRSGRLAKGDTADENDSPSRKTVTK